VFDDPNLVPSAGLVPAMALTDAAGLRELTDSHLSVPTDKGATAGLKVPLMIAGMAAGDDSIDDLAVLRHVPASTDCGKGRRPSAGNDR